MKFPLERFWQFSKELRIPSKEQGAVPLDPVGTQLYFMHEVARGLEDGIHYFVTLKGRQQGFSTIHCALDLFWNLDHSDMQGLVITDSDDNHTYFRDIIAEMLGTLPPDYRLEVVVNNDDMLRFGRREDGFGGSRLMYQVAGVSKRKRAKLGRGRGVNYLHGDELGYWQDQKSIGGLNRSLAETNPLRLYSFGGTANGKDVLWEMWNSAAPGKALTRRRIFVGWWRHEGHVIPKGTPLFEAYGTDPLSEDERSWAHAIRDAYGVEISDEQWAWYRYQLAVEFNGDEDMRAQEEPCVPEDAFVSFGDKFIKPSTIRRLRAGLAADPLPETLRYEWGRAFDETRLFTDRSEAPQLRIWEQPEDGGVYMIGARPADGISDDNAIVVYRIYPDLMRQVAEYWSRGDTTYQFTWALIMLAAGYSPLEKYPAFMMVSLDGNGAEILKQMDLMRDAGWGLSPQLRGRQDIRDALTRAREYLYRRVDNFSKRASRHFKGNAMERSMVMHGLRDCIERDVMQVRSALLIDELAAVRRGVEAVDNAEGARVVAAALAARHYMDTAIPEIDTVIPPSVMREQDPQHVGQFQVQRVIARVLAGKSPIGPYPVIG